jgi:hypothetical protein
VNLDAVRAELPVLDHVAYLNTGSFGPLPRRAVDAMVEQQQIELEEGRSGHAYWDVIHEARSAMRAALADALGASEQSVALARSTTEPPEHRAWVAVTVVVPPTAEGAWTGASAVALDPGRVRWRRPEPARVSTAGGPEVDRVSRSGAVPDVGGVQRDDRVLPWGAAVFCFRPVCRVLGVGASMPPGGSPSLAQRGQRALARSFRSTRPRRPESGPQSNVQLDRATGS